MEYGYVASLFILPWRILVIGSYICVTRIVCRFQPADNQENKQENTADDKFTAYLPAALLFIYALMALTIFQDVEYREYSERRLRRHCARHKNTLQECTGWWFVICKATPETARQRKVAKVAKGYEWTRGHFVIFLTDGPRFCFFRCVSTLPYISRSDLLTPSNKKFDRLSNSASADTNSCLPFPLSV